MRGSRVLGVAQAVRGTWLGGLSLTPRPVFPLEGENGQVTLVSLGNWTM